MKTVWKTIFGMGAMQMAMAAPVYKGAAVLVVKPAKMEEFKQAVHQIMAPTRAERGNLSYEAFQVIDEQGKPTNRFEFHEVWKTREAMMVDHKENSPHMKEFFRRVRFGEPDSMLESFSVTGSYAEMVK